MKREKIARMIDEKWKRPKVRKNKKKNKRKSERV